MDILKLDSGREISITSDGNYRGWDAADQYVLNELPKVNRTLVIEDVYGAISAGVDGEVFTYTSSYLNKKHIDRTIKDCGRVPNTVTNIDQLPEEVDLIVMRLPKFIDLFEFYLQVLTERYHSTPIIITGMVKYMPITMVRLMEEYYNDVKTSLARKKARLIYGTVANKKSDGSEFPFHYKTDDGVTVTSYPGVFSANHLDIGTRLLLDNLPELQSESVVDLGAGSGIIGLTAKKRYPGISITFTDISYLSENSISQGLKENSMEGEVRVTDVLEGFENNSVDIILCNPPFHNSNRVEVDIARKMFKESHRVLKRGGTLTVVANRHLGYHKILRSIFHNLKRVDENKKFNIFQVRK